LHRLFKVMSTSVLAVLLTAQFVPGAYAANANLTLLTITPDVVSGSNATFTMSGTHSTYDYSNLQYEVSTQTGREVEMRFSYRSESAVGCIGEAIAVSGVYDLCSFEASRSFLNIPVAISNSSSLSLDSLSITVLENVSELIQVRAWIDDNDNGFRDIYEPFSAVKTVRNYAPNELPALLEYSFDAPVWGERFSASVGMKRGFFLLTFHVHTGKELQRAVLQ